MFILIKSKNSGNYCNYHCFHTIKISQPLIFFNFRSLAQNNSHFFYFYFYFLGMKSMACMTLRLVVATLLLSRSMGDEQRMNYGGNFASFLTQTDKRISNAMQGIKTNALVLNRLRILMEKKFSYSSSSIFQLFCTSSITKSIPQ